PYHFAIRFARCIRFRLTFADQAAVPQQLANGESRPDPAFVECGHTLSYKHPLYLNAAVPSRRQLKDTFDGRFDARFDATLPAAQFDPIGEAKGQSFALFPRPFLALPPCLADSLALHPAFTVTTGQFDNRPHNVRHLDFVMVEDRFGNKPDNVNSRFQ